MQEGLVDFLSLLSDLVSALVLLATLGVLLSRIAFGCVVKLWISIDIVGTTLIDYSTRGRI